MANRSTINGSLLNGAAKSVRSADAFLSFGADFTGSAVRRCTGAAVLETDAVFLITHSAPVEIAAGLDAKAIRRATGAINLGLSAGFSPRVERRGGGDAVLGSLLSGGASATRFSDGVGLTQLEASLALVRAHQGGGDAAFTLAGIGQLVRHTELTTLLSGGINGRMVDGGGPVNVVRQLTLERGSGFGLTSLTAKLDGARRRCPTGVDAPLILAGDFAPVGYRRSGGAAEVELAVDLTEQVSRAATGTSVISFHTSLFYTRTQTGSGGSLISLIAYLDAGVRFGGGSIAIAPLTPILDGQRHKRSSGRAEFGLQAGFLASAIRRFEASDELKVIQGAELDPAHITSGGVRYITAGADSVIEPALIVEDGMRRGTGLGDVSFDIFAATGALKAVRHPPISIGHIEFLAEEAFHIQRMTTGAVSLELYTEATGEVYVEAEGDAVVSLVGAFTPVAYRRTASGAAEIYVDTELGGQRNKNTSGVGSISLLAPELAPIAYRQGFGQLVPEISIDLDATRKPVLDGELDTEVALGGEGDIFVRYEGDVEIDLAAGLEGYAYKTQADVGKIELGLFSNLDGSRKRWSTANTAIEIHGIGDPIRLLGLDGYVELAVDIAGSIKESIYFDGQAAMEVVTSSDAYLNPSSDDPTEQKFYRPGEQREFIRPEEQRDYLRAA